MLGTDYLSAGVIVPILYTTHWRLERLSNLPKATEQIRGQVRIFLQGLPD